MSKSKEIAKPAASTTELADFKVFELDGERLSEVIKANLGTQGISTFDMDRIKIPAGGSTVWQAPTLTGIENVESIEGIIIHFRDVRAYWPEEYTGANVPPSCSSDNGVVGVGDPGGACQSCKFALFGSADKGEGQACKQSRMCFVLRPTDLMPVVIPLPPTSLKACKSYFYRLASKVLQFQDVVTRFTLTESANATGMKYSKCELNVSRLLTDEEIMKVRSAAIAMREAFGTVTIKADDLPQGGA